jgi:hypothetical protein
MGLGVIRSLQSIDEEVNPVNIETLSRPVEPASLTVKGN